MPKDPVSQRDFLSTLWGADNHGVAELTLIGRHGIKAMPFAYPADLDKLIETANQNNGVSNVFFGVCLRREKWPRKSGKKNYKGEDETEYRGTKENALSSMVVWVDIDFKSTPKDQALKLATEFPLKPSFVVKSGGGVHLYWLLKEPAVSTDLNLRVPGINAALAKVLKGDAQAVDLARILRFPGTQNLKYDAKPVCEISLPAWKPELQYTLDDFDFLSPAVEPLPDPAAAAVGTPSSTGNGAPPAGPTGGKSCWIQEGALNRVGSGSPFTFNFYA